MTPIWLCFSCRELSRSLQCEGYGLILLFGVKAVRCLVPSDGPGGSKRCNSTQRGCAGTAAWVAGSGLAIEDCFSMQVRSALRELFFCWKWASCTTFLRSGEKKTIRAVVRHILKVMSGRMEHNMSIAALHPMVICHGNRERLVDGNISLGGAPFHATDVVGKKAQKIVSAILEFTRRSETLVTQEIAGNHCAGSVSLLAGRRLEKVPSCAESGQVDDCHCERWGVYAFTDDKMVPACVEAAQKFKSLRDPERASSWYGVPVLSRKLLFGTYVTSLRAGELDARQLSVDDYTSWYSERLARRTRMTPTKLLLFLLLLRFSNGRKTMWWLVVLRKAVSLQST